MTVPQASIVIPTRNRQQRLARLLDSLRQQMLAADAYEIVVVDDGSTIPVAIPSVSSPAVSVVRLEGAERSAARNAGAASARAQIVIFVDDDATVGRDFVSAHIDAHGEWPGALVVGRATLEPQAVETAFSRFRRRIESDGVPTGRGPVAARNFCAAINMSMRSDRFEALGGFEPTIVSGEDQDLALRHTAAGGVIVYLPEAEAIHHDPLDIRGYCRRAEWGMEAMIPFCMRHADFEDNIARHRVNGPVDLGAEPLSLSATKIAKTILGSAPIRHVLFTVTRAVELIAPRSMTLERFYTALLGIHLRRGFMRGLRRHRALPTRLNHAR
jgi:GT2 family glycosyltransferase